MTGRIRCEWVERSLSGLLRKTGAIVVLQIAHQPGGDLVSLELASNERVVLRDRPRLRQASHAQHDQAARSFRNRSSQNQLPVAIELLQVSGMKPHDLRGK